MDSNVLPRPRTPAENKKAADDIMNQRREDESREQVLRVTDLGAQVAAGARRLSVDDASGVDRTSVNTANWKAAADALIKRRKAAAANKL